MMGFVTSPRLSFGPGAVELLSGLGARRAFVLVDPTLAKGHRERRLVEQLETGGSTVGTFAEVEVEPTVASVERAARALVAFTPDLVVALGGGSTIDTAKAAWVAYEQPEFPLAEPPPLLELKLRVKARFVAVPTTSGSGSDASWLAQYRTENGQLVELASRDLVPDWSLLDAAFPATQSRELTATSGADAIAHALEAFVSPWTNPFSDALARDALERLPRDLPTVARHGDDLDARLSVHFAATHAGLAVSNAQAGLTHALAHAVGAVARRPHGRLVAALLPRVTEFNFPAIRDRLGQLGGPLGLGAGHGRTTLADRLRELWGTLGLPTTLLEAGVSNELLTEHLDRIVAETLAAPGALSNPRVASAEEARELLLPTTDAAASLR
ncbi:MAG: iron-containing alcohol dehydrogenase [Thermoplasmata archaeon]|nr:iron-containing alcohol dehydrogenase [Thermoplasmata archaeon]